MFVVKWILITLVVLILMSAGVGQMGFLAGKDPTDLGVKNGRLKPPALTPNSVSSQALLYPGHLQMTFAQIAPLEIRGDGPATIAQIKAITQAQVGVSVVKSTQDYLYLHYTSRWMRYVDDVEFWFDPVNMVIQVRSASRLGKGDLGVNRARIESLRATLNGKSGA
ncbi:MAG: DUF1499 domain-containing protein [Burkholderiales bacterium]|jgi:uncharacterized protein (DUF1499 family)|nr:DUF1499 domain-containing protein [Burkholderiales bacterium]